MVHDEWGTQVARFPISIFFLFCASEKGLTEKWRKICNNPIRCAVNLAPLEPLRSHHILVIVVTEGKGRNLGQGKTHF